MPRRPRRSTGGVVYHALNRANARATLFHKDEDYAAFCRTLLEAYSLRPTRLLAWCLMPNHWHLVVWPREDGELSQFVGWLTHTHTQRYHAHYQTAGTGHVYQGRFKSFPIQEDDHLLTAIRYVERNPVRAGLVERARDWPWSSAGARAERGDAGLRRLVLGDAQWPVNRRADWEDWVDQPQTGVEEAAVRASVVRGRPFGVETWVADTAERLGLGSTLKQRGRPRIREMEVKVNNESRPL